MYYTHNEAFLCKYSFFNHRLRPNTLLTVWWIVEIQSKEFFEYNRWEGIFNQSTKKSEFLTTQSIYVFQPKISVSRFFSGVHEWRCHGVFQPWRRGCGHVLNRYMPCSGSLLTQDVCIGSSFVVRQSSVLQKVSPLTLCPNIWDTVTEKIQHRSAQTVCVICSFVCIILCNGQTGKTLNGEKTSRRAGDNVYGHGVIARAVLLSSCPLWLAVLMTVLI